ncbi:unnamed protein product [Cochlearia groenlandica]
MSCNTKNLLHIIFIVILCICLNRSCIEGALNILSQDSCSYTIQVSSLFPSSSSSSSNRKSSLDVVHRHGPCSRLGNSRAASIDLAEILRHDQARVNSIHSKLSKKPKDQAWQTQATTLPAKSGRPLGTGNYYVTVGIGTPKNDVSLVFDTGSDLTWTQCKPCRGSCYSQKEPIFDPSSSSSYSNISCSSPVCDTLTSEGLSKQCSPSNCLYGTAYGDKSFTTGTLAKEKFTLTTSNVVDGVTFGCGENNQGLFKGTAGLLGLGRGKFSFPSQTTTTYNNIFSYCLPSSSDKVGHLTFGSEEISNSVKYTPISSSSSTTFYGLDIEAISVGDQKLDIPLTVFSSPGAIIDSGTVITRLPPKAYVALRTAFKEKMSNYKASSKQSSLLDTCYDFTGLETVDIPNLSFTFGGGTVVDLDMNGVLAPYDISQVCLAFAGNDNDNDTAIFGNTQQKTLEVVHDGPGGRVGFAPNGCS